MRHILPNFVVSENLPECPTCSTVSQFAKNADVAKDGRVHLIFRCPACGTETKVWRPDWQKALAGSLAEED